MSGPRITTGKNSKQDYQTPQDFLTAVEKRFGPIAFDLAAHANNHVHRDYFAPTEFSERIELGKVTTLDIMRLSDSLCGRGVSTFDSNGFALKAIEDNAIHHAGAPKANQVREYTLQNSDTAARAFDSLSQPWSTLTGGLLWLNCEFGDIKRWAGKCAEAAAKGAEILLLTTASVGSNWARDIIFPNADVYLLNGRLSFDGRQSFPKDLMLSHFRPSGYRWIRTWGWRADVIHGAWNNVGTLIDRVDRSDVADPSCGP